MQRTILVGWLMLVDKELTFIRLLTALIVTIAFLVVILVCQPYRRIFDQIMASGCQIFFVCIFLGGMAVFLYNEISTNPSGSPACASQLLGWDSSEGAVTLMICIAFAMLLLLALTLFANSYDHVVQRRLRSKWAVCTLDPPIVKRWKLRGIYACFISHYKLEAASEARCARCSGFQPKTTGRHGPKNRLTCARPLLQICTTR